MRIMSERQRQLDALTEVFYGGQPSKANISAMAKWLPKYRELAGFNPVSLRMRFAEMEARWVTSQPPEKRMCVNIKTLHRHWNEMVPIGKPNRLRDFIQAERMRMERAYVDANGTGMPHVTDYEVFEHWRLLQPVGVRLAARRDTREALEAAGHTVPGWLANDQQALQFHSGLTVRRDIEKTG